MYTSSLHSVCSATYMYKYNIVWSSKVVKVIAVLTQIASKICLLWTSSFMDGYFWFTLELLPIFFIFIQFYVCFLWIFCAVRSTPFLTTTITTTTYSNVCWYFLLVLFSCVPHAMWPFSRKCSFVFALPDTWIWKWLFECNHLLMNMNLLTDI